MATPVIAQDLAARVDLAIQEADHELQAAAQAGQVWRMADEVTRDRDVSIEKLLEIAREKRSSGNLDEALRLARKVASAARLGQEQAHRQQDVKPLYTY